MIEFKQGNLLDADVEAVVNTVNTVGVMGKGIALMFKERFPANFKAYKSACKKGEVQTGKMFVTETGELSGPKYIINFPTKNHWRYPTELQWVKDGLADLLKVINQKKITSIAIPPLGCGNGGLDWKQVKPLIQETLQAIPQVTAIVFEPTREYQNVMKKTGVNKLTPARALIAELVRRYSILGIDCSILEIQKLAWFAERVIEKLNKKNFLNLQFTANKYGPYTDRLQHLLNGLDGSYLHCEKRLRDAGPFDSIWFDNGKKDEVKYYIAQNQELSEIIYKSEEIIDGFQSPLGMELMATIDWLITNEKAGFTLASIKSGLSNWPGSREAAGRKIKIFSDKMIEIALQKLKYSSLHDSTNDTHVNAS